MSRHLLECEGLSAAYTPMYCICIHANIRTHIHTYAQTYIYTRTQQMSEMNKLDRYISKSSRPERENEDQRRGKQSKTLIRIAGRKQKNYKNHAGIKKQRERRRNILSLTQLNYYHYHYLT